MSPTMRTIRLEITDGNPSGYRVRFLNAGPASAAQFKSPPSLFKLSPLALAPLHLPHPTSHHAEGTGGSLNPRGGVRQRGTRHTSPGRQYGFGTPWPAAAPSETLAAALPVSAENGSHCVRQPSPLPPPPPPPQSPPFPLKPSTASSPSLVQPQGRQVNPNCMLIRALRTSP